MGVDFAAVMARVHAVVADIEQDESPELLAREGIDLVQGWGVVTGPTSLDVDGRAITFDGLVVAVGSRAFVPPIEGLADVAYLDNRNVFALTELPEHLMVLGGGPIGVELAQAFRRLGSEVTVVEAMPTVLGREEPEATQALTAVLEREGVRLRTGAAVEQVSAGPTLHLADGSTVTGSHLLVAVGRRPATDGIGLETAGVRTEQGRPAAENAFAGRWPWSGTAWDDSVVPWVTFTEPEVAHVGLTEQQAAQVHGSRARVSIVRDTHGDRARTAGETDGFVKLIAVPGNVGGMALGKLVGMTIVGPMAGEQIAQGALSMRAGTLVTQLAQTVSAYPTWSLSTRIAAARFFGAHGGARARAVQDERETRA